MLRPLPKNTVAANGWKKQKYNFKGKSTSHQRRQHQAIAALMLYSVYNASHMWGGAERWNWSIHQTVSDCKYCPIIANIPTICRFAHRFKCGIKIFNGLYLLIDKYAYEITFDKEKEKMLKRQNICYIFEEKIWGAQGRYIWYSQWPSEWPFWVTTLSGHI